MKLLKVLPALLLLLVAFASCEKEEEAIQNEYYVQIGDGSRTELNNLQSNYCYYYFSPKQAGGGCNEVTMFVADSSYTISMMLPPRDEYTDDTFYVESPYFCGHYYGTYLYVSVVNADSTEHYTSKAGMLVMERMEDTLAVSFHDMVFIDNHAPQDEVRISGKVFCAN